MTLPFATLKINNEICPVNDICKPRTTYESLHQKQSVRDNKIHALLLMSYIFMYHYLDISPTFQQNLYNSSPSQNFEFLPFHFQAPAIKLAATNAKALWR